MQVTETNAEGLRREIQIVVPVQDLNERCNKRLDEIKDSVEIRGFRKGRVPKPHLKKIYGRRLMLEVMQEAVEQSSQQALTDRNERPAAQPEIQFPEDEGEIEDIVKGAKDFSYSMRYEIIPPIELVDFATLEVERLVSDVEDDEVNEQLEIIAARNVTYVADNEAEAGDGDQLKIDFVGRIDGEAFDGGNAEDIDIVIGQSGFIDGFEEGLKGGRAGEERQVMATFPEDYTVEELKGKYAIFDVTIKEVGKPQKPAIDDEFAQSVGMEDLEKLKDAIRAQIGREYEQISRAKVKRRILDILDENHAFELPRTLSEAEFESIWKQHTQNMEGEGRSMEDMGKPEEELRTDYQKIADRRVRLGLVIGEIGERFEVQVEQSELREAMVQQARRFRGSEHHVYEYFEKTPGAIDQLRVPIFEDKVIDLLLSKVNLTDRKVSKEELMKPIDDELIDGAAEPERDD